jgi:ubiquinone/menaquinone biosynthesis C-methylase UbiE
VKFNPLMSELEEAKKKAATTYNAASDFYDHPANTFWERYGRRTVERLRLARGERVLDVCCGSGASAIPAAEIVGPDGTVIGVDLAENLLELARAKANQRGLTNIQFQSGDLTRLPFHDGNFNTAVCVFGIFFVPDMDAALRELKRVVCDGGRVAVTTWGPRFFEPASTAFWDSIRDVRPDLYKGFNPWDRISEVDAVVALLDGTGLSDVEAIAESDSQAVAAPEDWWAMIMGSGYRGTVEQLFPEERKRVHSANLDFIQRTSLRALEANVVYATGVSR